MSMFPMAGRGGGGTDTVAAEILTAAGATRTIGSSAGWTDSGSAIEFVAPAGSQVAQIGSVSEFLVWETSTTVSDAANKEIGVRLRNLSTPAGSSMSVVLWYGIAFAADAASYNPATTPTCVVWHHLGRATNDNSTCRVGTTNDNGGINSGTSVGVLDRSELRINIGGGGGNERGLWQLLSYGDGVTGTRWDNAQNNATLTGSHKLLVVLGVCRSDTEASPSGDISAILEWMAPGADWTPPS